MIRRWAVLLFALCVSTGCEPGGQKQASWIETADAQGFRVLSQSPQLCATCVSFERVVRLGATTGEGFLVAQGDSDYILRDAAANYWVGQGENIKVFSSAGELLRVVGRAGQGPLEFQRARPVHLDDRGAIHIIDIGNNRETVLGPNGDLIAEKPFPRRVRELAPLGNGERYVVHMFVQTADRIGLPLHIIEGTEILHSFGVPTARDQLTINNLSGYRLIATDSEDRIYTASLYDYAVEVWSESGNRMAGLTGPQLAESSPLPGPWTAENPPSNMIRDLHVDDEAHLWVLRFDLAEDWRNHMKEQITVEGRVLLVPLREESLPDIYESRIDVIDLESASIISSSQHSEYLLWFLEDGSIVSQHYNPEWDIQFDVLKPQLSPGTRK